MSATNGPNTYTGFSKDADQELKEAVCDAVLERTRRVVTGAGEFGAVIFGQQPSLALASGFLVPRLDSKGDDVSNDIAISTHGLDCRLGTTEVGEIRITPRLSVYVGVMPTTSELFDKRLKLLPKPALNKTTDDQIIETLRGLRENADFRAMSIADKKEERIKTRLRILRDLGVTVEGLKEVEDAEAVVDGDDLNGTDILDDSARIPDQYAVEHSVPIKYIRLTPEVPVLSLPLPWDKNVWIKITKDYEKLLNEAIEQAYYNWLVSPDGRDWAWRPVRLPGSSFWSSEHWEAKLIELRKSPPDIKQLFAGMKLSMLVDVRPDPLNPETLTVRFALENCQEGKGKGDQGIFDTSLRVTMPRTALRPMPMERVRRSYNFAGFMLIPAIGVNGGVVHSENDGEAILETTWCPRFVLPRMRPTGRTSVPVNFVQLSNPDLNVSEIMDLPLAMKNWIEEVESNLTLFEPGEEGTKADERRQTERFKSDVTAWNREADRIRLGINVLVRSQKAYRADPLAKAAIPYRAWLLLNQTFSEATSNPGWRLFQLGFILTHIPTFASRLPDFSDMFDQDFDEDSASLLYMSTGGGKSEAFFGVLIFALFLDRMRGKHRGVTAMLRYPLRLLTLQQARRLIPKPVTRDSRMGFPDAAVM